MTCLYHIFILYTSFFLISSAQDCGPTESNGKVCKSDCCPQPEGQSSCCPGTCITDEASDCSVFDLRAPNGTCIRGTECPAIPCDENEEFDPCPVCSEECDNASPDGRRCRFVGKIGVTVICRPACRCIKNFWRNEFKDCVYYTECPKYQNGD